MYSGKVFVQDTSFQNSFAAFIFKTVSYRLLLNLQNVCNADSSLYSKVIKAQFPVWVFASLRSTVIILPFNINHATYQIVPQLLANQRPRNWVKV